MMNSAFWSASLGSKSVYKLGLVSCCDGSDVLKSVSGILCLEAYVSSIHNDRFLHSLHRNNFILHSEHLTMKNIVVNGIESPLSHISEPSIIVLDSLPTNALS